MSAPTYFLGTMKDGKLVPDDKASIARFLATKKDGTRIRLTMVKDVPRRTDGMNRFWWKCIVEPFQTEMGLDDKDEVHRLVLIQIGHWEHKEIFGEQRKVPKPTHNLPENQFMELVNKAERLFAEYFDGRLPGRDTEHARAMMQSA